VREAPRRLLSRIEGLVLVEHAEADMCCGAAGTYGLTQPEMSRAVLDRKLDAIEITAPDVVATGNPGCLMQLAAGVRSRGWSVRVAHPVELLDEASAGAHL
jgi:glycolate oxidase iron-sulfur subunit